MSDPNRPYYPGEDPYAPGGQPGYPGQPQFPGQQPYPAQQQPYPGQQQYPGPPQYQPQDPSQQYSGPPQYPSQQFYGQPSGPPPAPARPATVTYSVWCWIGTIAFSMVGLVLILNSPVWNLAIATARLSAAEAVAAQSALNLLKGFIVFLFVAVAALFAFLAWKVWTGRNWSRITITVLGVVCALLTALPASRDVTIDARSYATPQGQWPFYVTAVLVLAAIVLMFLSTSNRFFTDYKTHLQGKSYHRTQR